MLPAAAAAAFVPAGTPAAAPANRPVVHAEHRRLLATDSSASEQQLCLACHIHPSSVRPTPGPGAAAALGPGGRVPRIVRAGALKWRQLASHAGAEAHPHAHASAQAHAAAQTWPSQHAAAGTHSHVAHAHAEAAAHHAHVIPSHVVAAALPHDAHANIAELLHAACPRMIGTDFSSCRRVDKKGRCLAQALHLLTRLPVEATPHS